MASLGEDLLVTVNKLQDLVFNTIGNDSLDLPQIVSEADMKVSGDWDLGLITLDLGRCRLPIIGQVVSIGEHRRSRLLTTRQRHRYSPSLDPATYQHP